MSKKSEKPIFFYNFIKENSKFSHLFLNCMLLQWKKKHFFDISIKIRYETIDLSGSMLGQASNSGSESPFKS